VAHELLAYQLAHDRGTRVSDSTVVADAGRSERPLGHGAPDGGLSAGAAGPTPPGAGNQATAGAAAGR